MEKKYLLARLDKKGERVMCGVVDCGTPLALVLPDGAKRVVWFGGGWTYKSPGVWMLGDHGRSVVQVAKRVQDVPRLNRDYSGMTFFDVLDRWFVEASKPLTRGYSGMTFLRLLEKPGRVPVLPALAQCPLCQRLQMLTPDSLKVVSADPTAAEPAWTLRKATEAELSRYQDLIQVWQKHISNR